MRIIIQIDETGQVQNVAGRHVRRVAAERRLAERGPVAAGPGSDLQAQINRQVRREVRRMMRNRFGETGGAQVAAGRPQRGGAGQPRQVERGPVAAGPGSDLQAQINRQVRREVRRILRNRNGQMGPGRWA